MNSSETAPPIPRILVIGVGRMGCRTLNDLHHEKVRKIRTLGIDTDVSELKRCHADARILIKSSLCDEVGWKRTVDCGRKAAEKGRTRIEEQCAGADVILLCAGLGRVTGSGASPVVAEIARQTGALVVGIVAMPFVISGIKENITAQQALGELLGIADALVVFDNNQCLTQSKPNSFQLLRYQPWHDIRVMVIKDVITRIFLNHSTDQPRIRRIVSGGGAAVVMHGDRASGDDMYTLLKNCTNFSCRDYAITGGNGAIVLLFGEEPIPITADDDADIRRAFDLADNAEVICEWRRQERVGDKIRVMCLVTGLHKHADGKDPWTVAERVLVEEVDMRRIDEIWEEEDEGKYIYCIEPAIDPFDT